MDEFTPNQVLLSAPYNYSGSGVYLCDRPGTCICTYTLATHSASGVLLWSSGYERMVTDAGVCCAPAIESWCLPSGGFEPRRLGGRNATSVS